MNGQRMAGMIAVAALVSCATIALGEPQDGAGKMRHGQKPGTEQMAAWHERFCTDRFAMVAGKLAFLEAKLSISDGQRPAFDQWRDIVLSDAKGRQQACLSRTPTASRDHAGNALEREAMAEKMLSERLQALQAQRPALESLYRSLTPAQKMAFDESRWHGMRHHGGGHGETQPARG